jgi:hypothetical protein|tara:strand:- start:9042 stop:9566 length:525 start_codon:yes stop_codon:yes gene_type:complete
MENSFNIRIKDNFFNDSIFKEIYNNVDHQNYSPDSNVLQNLWEKHIWYASNSVKPEVKQYVKTKCEEIINKKLEMGICNYTMVATVTPLVHCDKKEGITTHQALVYIKGNEKLTKGTGFYVKEEGSFILNTHVGFKENRVIIWDSEAWHSPLNWSSDDKQQRYSIIAQFKELNE